MQISAGEPNNHIDSAYDTQRQKHGNEIHNRPSILMDGRFIICIFVS
ncbi:hypothetical protein B0I21_1058 [Sphingobacterium paludis]|uniref:Uncharacterized protein n=1 Tax=Sphingobacterium paludis TaxID=1476465 RepID=A0A4R7CY62_9SPHI|nr:hypothetical protein B0I21_1058 [Sphingobacterium paludis]